MKSRVRNIIIAVITLLFIYLIIRNISIQNTIDSFRRLGLSTFAIILFFHFVVYYLRCVSMSIFLDKEVRFSILLNAHFFHNFYLNVFPASMGELSLPFLLERWVSKMKTMAVLFITRLFSLIVTLLVFAITILIIFKRFSIIQVNWIALGLLAVAGMAALVAAYFGTYYYKGTNGILLLVQKKMKSLLGNIKEYAINNFTWSKALVLFLIALLNIILLTFYVEAVFVKLGIYTSLIDLLFIMTVQVVILILPIKSFGGFGTFEGSWVVGMLLLGFNKQQSLESGLIVHLLQLFTAAVFLLIGLATRYTVLKKYYVD